MEDNKIQSSLIFDCKTPRRLKKESPDKDERFMTNFYKEAVPERLKNQDIVSTIFDLDQSTAGLDQDITDLAQTYGNIMI